MDHDHDDLADKSLEELQQMIQRIQQTNNFLKKENVLFDSYLKRAGVVPASSSKQHPHAPLVLQQLSLEQKFLIATSELKEIKEEIEATKERSEGVLEKLRSLREETEIRIAELKKEAYEFRRDIVSGVMNPRTNKIMAEKIVKYFEEKIRFKENLIDKFKAKNVAMKNQNQKIEAQLQHKEEMGEMFLPIDFDQLKIENQQYLEKIEERNEDLLLLKVTAGNTLRILSNQKVTKILIQVLIVQKKLYNMAIEFEKLKAEIKVKEDNLQRLNDEAARVGFEKETAYNRNSMLKSQLEEYRVPKVLEYVKLNAEVHDIAKKIKDWERKIEIAEMAYKKARQIHKQLITQQENDVLQPISSPLRSTRSLRNPLELSIS